MQQKSGTHSNIPVRGTSLILAGIRADKHHHLTFPCIQHSGIEGWLARKILRLFTVAGAAHSSKRLCVSRLTANTNMSASTKTVSFYLDEPRTTRKLVVCIEKPILNQANFGASKMA